MTIAPEAAARRESMLSRAMRILQAFDETTSTLSISQISRRVNLPIPTTHRLVNELLSFEFLERDDDRNIRVGLRLWELAARSTRVVGLRESAMPHMQRLNAYVRQHTQLAVLDGTDVLYLERMTWHGATVSNVTSVASRLQGHTCSSGIVLLGHATHDVQEAALGRPLAAFTPHTITDPGQLRREFAETRRRGYAIASRCVHLDAAGAAAPIRNAAGDVIAALSVIVPADGNHLPAAVPALLATANEITRALAA